MSEGTAGAYRENPEEKTESPPMKTYEFTEGSRK